MHELYEWGSMYEEKFGYIFTRFTNKYAVELDIASKEEIKYIELHITEFLFKKFAQTTNKGDDGTETNPEDNLIGIYSVEIVILRQFDLNKVREKDNETLDNQQRQHDVHAAKRGFNLNKKPWFGDELSDPVSREGSRFLIEYFWPSQYDVEEKF
ncbi:hypothetical protein Ahy_A01g004623 [Arachis hypogaea]|uniref:Uncharacterized protein n=1 Tax=Arachis hypogaea TaxID=3818 RepID=A0A445EWL3_ARAHY|nr:hypothetical protein Ahy_A01g004623 [Arachis hypogaea]